MQQCPPACPRVVEELIPAACHVTEQYANNVVEVDHGRLKARLRPMRGVKRLPTYGIGSQQSSPNSPTPSDRGSTAESRLLPPTQQTPRRLGSSERPPQGPRRACVVVSRYVLHDLARPLTWWLMLRAFTGGAARGALHAVAPLHPATMPSRPRRARSGATDPLRANLRRLVGHYRARRGYDGPRISVTTCWTAAACCA